MINKYHNKLVENYYNILILKEYISKLSCWNNIIKFFMLIFGVGAIPMLFTHYDLIKSILSGIFIVLSGINTVLNADVKINSLTLLSKELDKQLIYYENKWTDYIHNEKSKINSLNELLYSMVDDWNNSHSIYTSIVRFNISESKIKYISNETTKYSNKIR